MFSKLLLVSLFAAGAVAAPALAPYQPPEPDVPCTSTISPQRINPAPSPSVILLNSPSAVGSIAGPQGPGNPAVINLNTPSPSPSFINLNAPASAPTPPVINLNAPASPASVIKLDKRQLSSTATSTFSFGGIVPSDTIFSSTPLSSSGTPTAGSLLPSFSGLIASSSSAPAPTAPPSPGALGSTSTFSSIGPDGVKTILLLSTVTVSGAACSSAPAFNPQAFVPPQASSSAPLSIPSVIDLNSPSPTTTTSAPGFSFSSAPAANSPPAV